MILRHIKTILFTILTMVGFAASGLAQRTTEEGHILVSLRIIGHQILLQSGDSTSRILPVEKEGRRFKLQFASDFQFDPGHLVFLVDSVVEKSQIAGSYRVEVESCLKKQVVYSYEMGNSQKLDLVACRGRIQPKGCYTLFFTILDFDNHWPVQGNLSIEPSESAHNVQKRLDYSAMAIVTLSVLLLAGVSVYFTRKRVAKGGNPNYITLGEYEFNTRNMELRHKDEVTELSSKESDLLLLLYNSANNTLERELILKAVWGDEGDYVGRTLDVFISKLRKKLDADPGLKIVNVRGVGYKLILNA